MRELLRKLLEEEEAGAFSLETLSEDLRKEIEARVNSAIISQGFNAIKVFLRAF